MAFEYNKQPWEEEIIGVDFSRRIPAGVTVQAVQTGVTDCEIEEIVGLTGQNPNDYVAGHLTLATPVLAGASSKILTVMVSDGVANFKYRVSFRVTLSDNQKKEDDVWVIVKET